MKNHFKGYLISKQDYKSVFFPPSKLLTDFPRKLEDSSFHSGLVVMDAQWQQGNRHLRQV